MTRYLTLSEILLLHSRIISASGGSHGLRDPGALESALAQPRAIFGGAELYPAIVDKGSILGYCLISNHPFIDGNKRIGHAAMEVFLILNGHGFACGIDEQEMMILGVASGEKNREEFRAWVIKHTTSPTT